MPSTINSDNGVSSGTSGLKSSGGNDGILTFQSSGTETMRIDASGNVGIGTTSINKKLVVSNAGAAGVEIDPFTRSATTGGSLLAYNRSGAAYVRMDYDASEQLFFISGSEKMRLDSSGNLGIGTSSPAYKVDASGQVRALEGGTGSGDGGFVASTSGANGNAGVLFQTNGASRWNLTTTGTNGATLRVYNYAAASSFLTLDSSGNLGIGTSSPGYKLDVSGEIRATSHVRGTGSDQLYLIGGASNNNNNIYIGGSSAGTANTIAFTTNGSERARITSGGDFLIGTTSLYGTAGLSVIPNASAGAVNVYWNRTATSSTSTAATFSDGGTPVGTITYTNTAVAYNTTSDYRLKDNQQPLTGSGAFIDALQPKTWEWKTDGSRGVGFIAHEVQTVSPGSVVGTKDAVDEEGKPVMQAMEYGSAEFIANIIAELQSLRARVAALESKGA